MLFRLLDELGVAFTDAFAIIAQHKVGEFGGHDLVGAHEHVKHRLGTHNLRGWRHERRVASCGTNSRHFFHHFVDAVAGALGLELGFHIGQHAAGDLRQEDIGVDQGFRLEFAVLRANRLEVVADLNQAIHIQVGGIAGAFQHFHEGFRGVVTWAKRQ